MAMLAVLLGLCLGKPPEATRLATSPAFGLPAGASSYLPRKQQRVRVLFVRALTRPTVRACSRGPAAMPRRRIGRRGSTPVLRLPVPTRTRRELETEGDAAPAPVLAPAVRCSHAPPIPSAPSRPRPSLALRRPDPQPVPSTRLEGPHPMNGLIRASLGNPHAVTVMSLTFIVLGALTLHPDPDRHPAGLQEPGRADVDVLRRDVGQQHRQRHHQPDGALDRPGQRHSGGRSRGRSSAPASSATTSRTTSIPTGP